MKEIIKVIIKEPGRHARVTEVRNELQPLQMLVGGYIEAVTIATDCVILCNEEGRINAMPYNCTILGEPFFGPILFVGRDGEEFDDVPEENVRTLFPALFEGEKT